MKLICTSLHATLRCVIGFTYFCSGMISYIVYWESQGAYDYIRVQHQHYSGSACPTTRRLCITRFLGGLFCVQELIKHCSHHTASFRLKSVAELCSLLSSRGSDVAADVGMLLDAVGSLFIDDDPKVRGESRRLLKIVFSHCKSVTSDVSPFFSLLISRLCCAMTHIHEDIR